MIQPSMNQVWSPPYSQTDLNQEHNRTVVHSSEICASLYIVSKEGDDEEERKKERKKEKTERGKEQHKPNPLNRRER